MAPAAVAEISDADGAIRVGLTKEQIRRAPPIEAAKPLSREYEEAYFRHFQWAPYWEPGPSEWASAVPFPETPPVPIDTTLPADAPKNPHLRSSSEIAGYDIQASNGAVGHLEDLVVDDETWTVRYLEVDTRNWLPGKKVVLSAAWISSVVPQKETVVMNIEKRRIQEAPEYRPEAQLDRDYETRLHDYYRFPYYWL